MGDLGTRCIPSAAAGLSYQTVNARQAGAARYFFAGMYFQFRGLPSASHLIDVANLSLRVSSRFASVTHSRYSRRLLGGKSSNVLRAFAFFFNAAVKSSGISRGSRFLASFARAP